MKENVMQANEIKETKNKTLENYQNIKPEAKHTNQEVNDFWKNEFHKEGCVSKLENNGQKNLDNNGKEYRDNDKLFPNVSYDINGYHYKTDEMGRIVEASGILKLSDPDYKRNMEDVRQKEGQEYRSNDDMGHLIGHQFGGCDKLGNLVPMDAKLNKGDFEKLENTLAAEVKDGKDVKLKVEPVYDNDSNRPSEFKVTYTVDGEKDVVVFKNGGEA